MIHIIIQRPPQVHAPVPARAPTSQSRPGARLSEEKWQQLVAKIEDDFFAPDSGKYTSLVQFVKSDANIPTTEGELSGLPFVLLRADEETNQPSLLFLSLPESVETQEPPSTADRALERIRGRAIPLLTFFGVSGCGKTRTAIEMLSKNWGFYFNGSETDWGSDDLLSFLTLVQQTKRCQNRDLESNIHVHILALALVLTRIIILHHCLDIAEREGTTFTCKDWMLLQVGFDSMGVEDLFDMLFTSVADTIQLHSVYITIIGPFVRERFSSLRQRLLDLTFDTPAQSFDYTILLVIDEAQNLGKPEFGSFPTRQLPPEAEQRAGAASIDKYMRPILTPLVRGFYGISADHNQFCVVPCGNDLSVFHTKWCEDPSFIKGYHTQLAPFTDFQGWESLEQVQHYRDLVCRSLPNSEARNIFNARVPDESIPELFARLRGRFRSIVSVIERMTMPNNGGFDWRQAIKETEDTLSSTESRYYSGGNIVFDISRMIQTAHNFEWRYGKYQNISTILKAFVLEHYLYGRPLLLNKEEAPLVEASVGRILPLGEHTATVLDEPLALRATVNYFHRSDPHFYSAISAFLDSGSKASVNGHQWEIVVLPSLAHVFHDKILSTTDLVPNWEKSWYPMLNGKAEIAGYANHQTLRTDFETMSLDTFLDTHVYHGSCKDGKSVPPFYLPVETASGPDVVFVLHLDNHGYCPVFVQLKCRREMTRTEGQSSFSTAESDEAQGHLQETMLQKYCTGHPKRFLGVLIAYPFEFAGVESTFPEIRRGGRIWLTQGDALQCISLNMDKNNFHDLCLKNHMQALDLLKENKRQLDQTDGDQGGNDQKDEPATKLRRCKDEGEDSHVNS